MSTDHTPTLDELFPWPKGIKFRTHKVGSNPTSPFFPVPVGPEQGTAPRPLFEMRWENKGLGVTAHVREQENGRLLADVFCTDANLLNKAWVSLSLSGTRAEYPISRSIPLNVAQPSGCSGSADFGLLANAVKELGPQLGLIVFLALLPQNGVSNSPGTPSGT